MHIKWHTIYFYLAWAKNYHKNDSIAEASRSPPNKLCEAG
jgi:hypothetical protein